ncbi:hypothetical protein [Streptomyces clavuligerus]|uniref:hypothetical protein n=1 Tax=Streptomyces clavuligerus TaxID=1901 RepID=UPI0001852073|nr:hypothetical protein [Streptomyces clavuligerus]MBY6307361.1 hypothetical protein [Streptomyces clavuligerus]QPJ97880.1 hypothetical protein GE265_33105 [Streptomyces clavuligerus]WDN56781.1 hypothetical protein LL058_33780 [Streptomyces clavuligerus]
MPDTTPTPPTVPGGTAPALASDTLDPDRIVAERYVTVRAAGQELSVTFAPFGSTVPADRETVVRLLPRARTLLADFAAVRERATEYLWDWGAEGEETEEEKAAFLRDVLPSALTVADGAGTEVHYENIGEEYMLDGYWPVVHHDAGLNPVRVTVEA